MKIAFLVARAAIQSVFSQLILLFYVLTTTYSAETTFTMTATLFLLLSLFQVPFGILFIRAPRILSLLIVPLISSFLTSLILSLYPMLGFIIDFWILFPVLLFAGIVAHVLLYSIGASSGDSRDHNE